MKQHLGNCAQALLDQMQAILEKSKTIASYHEDFYKYDSVTLADEFAPGAKFLWVIHSCGTHLTRYGVLSADPAKSMACAVLNSYSPSYLGRECEWYLITVASNGMSSLKQVTYEAARSAVYINSHYRVEGKSVYLSSMSGSSASKVCSFDIELVSVGPGIRDGIIHLNYDEKSSPARADLIAAVQIATRHLVETTGSLFTKTRATMINGKNFREVLPRLEINHRERGHFAQSQTAIAA